MTAGNGNLDSATYEQLARAAVERLPDPADIEAMIVCFNLIRAANRMQQDLETSVHRPAGLTGAGFRILFTIFVVGPTAPNQLAWLSSVSRASISSVLNTLDRDKLIVRRRSASDGRAVVVELTATGRRSVTKIFRQTNLREIEWAAALTHAERVTFTRLIRKLLTHHPSAPAPVSRARPRKSAA